jgi:hypothetical protein
MSETSSLKPVRPERRGGNHWPEDDSEEAIALANLAKRERERGRSREEMRNCLYARNPNLVMEYVNELVADTRELVDPPIDAVQQYLIDTAGGLLRRIIDYTLKMATRPQPWLALASALSVFSTVIGQKVATISGLTSNIYCIALCRSGGGKESPRQANKRILVMSGAEDRLGPDGVSSGPGFARALQKQPVMLLQIDEFGRALNAMNNPKAEGWQKQIVTALLQLWGSTRTVWRPNALADSEKNIVVEYPHVTLHGSSVPESVYQSVTREAMTNGLFGRLLVFDTGNFIPPLTLTTEADPPADLLAGLREWNDYKPGGNLGGQTQQPRTVPFSPEAERLYLEFAESTDDRMRSVADDEGGAIHARDPEKACKLALIHSASLSFDTAEIGAESMRWGIDLTEYLTAAFLASVENRLADNAHEELTNRLYRIIESAGPGGITQSDLTRKSQWLKARERTEIINDMQQAGRIRAVSRDTDGRTAVVLMLA